MFNKKIKKDKLDYGNLNKLIMVGEYLIIMVFVVLALYIITYINKEWGLLSVLFSFLKVLIPFFIGLAIAWLFNPIVKYLENKNVKRGIGAALVYFVFLLLLFLFFQTIVPTLYHQVNEIITSGPELASKFISSLDNLLINFSELYSFNFASLKASVYSWLTEFASSLTIDIPMFLVNTVRGIVSGSVQFLLGIFIGFYLLIDFEGIKKKVRTTLSKRNKSRFSILLSNLDTQLKRYVQGTLFVLIILFICQTVAFTIAGLPAPLVFGLVCAITNIIPYVGPYIGGIPAVIIGFTISPAVGVGTLIAVIACQFIESYFLTPLVMSKTMKLHPVVIIVSLLVFGHFFGIIGMLFATPIVSSLRILLNFIRTNYLNKEELI